MKKYILILFTTIIAGFIIGCGKDTDVSVKIDNYYNSPNLKVKIEELVCEDESCAIEFRKWQLVTSEKIVIEGLPKGKYFFSLYQGDKLISRIGPSEIPISINFDTLMH